MATEGGPPSGRLRVTCVVGTRPNFMKAAPVLAELQRRPDTFEPPTVVHTGQHYDRAMSQIFLEELGIGEPDELLASGSGTHAAQTARVLEAVEEVLIRHPPDVLLVVGDVNSTLAAALAAAKLDIPVGHVEAGLRSFDRTMPEEINRVLVDAIADPLFTHSPEARTNLEAEGRPSAAIHEVGNTMIDMLVAMRDRIAASDAPARHGVQTGRFLLVTLHRPSLVDGPLLAEAVARLRDVATQLPVLLPAHPRTREALARQAISTEGIELLEPLGYVEFLALMAQAAGVLTDSGGIQEETTFLGVPCLTLRSTTERPVTTELGTNVLLGLDPARIADAPELIETVRARPTRTPDLWDGRASERIADVLAARS